MTTPEETSPEDPGHAAVTHGDWSARLTDPTGVRAVLGAPPPPLERFELVGVQLDEREASVTLAFDARLVPAGAAAEWEAAGHTAVEFFLVCTGAAGFTADGWGHEPVTAVDLGTGPDAAVVLAGPGGRLSFTAAAVRAEGLRGYRAGPA